MRRHDRRHLILTKRGKSASHDGATAMQEVLPASWFAAYVTAYIERDVRQLLRVQELDTFQRFVRLCAGRTGQLLNLSSLATECGITHNTAKSWLSMLETRYRASPAPAPHQFQQAAGENAEALFLRRRARELAPGHSHGGTDGSPSSPRQHLRDICQCVADEIPDEQGAPAGPLFLARQQRQ